MPSASQPDQTISPRHRVAVFASGAGTNAAAIIAYFKDHPAIRVALVVCNKKGAGVLEIAAQSGIPVLEIKKERFLNGDGYVPSLAADGITFIVLAGFLWKVPATLISAFPGKIINIHPALLPSYGGKGMYGANVHAAVLANRERQSGITIHYVDEHYDNGDIIFQATCLVLPTDTPDSLAERVHRLEHRQYAPIIAQVLMGK
ncbi:MAG: phosphoribosylglycinamide formyltransferase [Flaviaesturariibacter sp.]|nr:phosphoribosylglycinamide formyltransferase [Flaviaesturariibacter sp.]